MSTFVGSIETKIDVKGRVALPATFRRLLPDEARERVLARLDPAHPCLLLYPESVWNKKVAELQQQLDDWDDDDRLLLAQFTASAEWIDIDAQGRILLSKRLQKAIGVTADALFIGMIDRIAVWERSAYEASLLSPEAFAARLKEKMRRPKAE